MEIEPVQRMRISEEDRGPERNYQLIENLMSRLEKMEAKVDERRKACDDDQNADSAMCSSKVPTLQQELDDRDEGPMQRRPSMFLREAPDGSYEVNVTFRSAPISAEIKFKFRYSAT